MDGNEVRIKITADDQASAKMQKTSGGMASAFQNVAKWGLLGMGGLVAGIGAVGIGFDNLKQQAMIAFTTMLGSGTKAKAFLDDLQDFAQKTPFEFKDLITGSQRLMAMGIEAKNVRPYLTAIGDAVAAMGGGSEMIGRVTNAIGQMKAKGKVSAEEVRQLAEAGIPAWQFLADKIGVSIPAAMKMAEQGAISADVGIGAIVDGMNGRFSGMMEKQSHTFGGLLSTLKDTFTQVAGEIMGPVFERLTRTMQRLADFTNSPEFQNGIKKWAENMADAFDAASDAAEPFFDMLLPALAQLEGNDLAIIVGVIGVSLVAAFVVATAAAMTFWTAVSLGTALLIPALIVAVMVLYRNWDAVWSGMKAAPAALFDWFKSGGWKDITLAFTAPWMLVLKYWNNIFDAMPTPVQTAMNFVAKIVGGTINFIIDALNKLTSKINDIKNFGGDLNPFSHTPDIPSVDNIKLTREQGGGQSGRGAGHFDDQFSRSAQTVETAVEGLTTGFDGGGGGGGLAGAIDKADTGLADLMNAFDGWHAQTQGSLVDFLALINAGQQKADLDKRQFEALVGLRSAEMLATDGAYQTRNAFVTMAEDAVRSGRSMTQEIAHLFEGIDSGIKSAFGSLNGSQTREGAELQLKIDQQQLKYDQAKRHGASQDELDHIQKNIDKLQEESKIRDDNNRIQKDLFDIANQMLPTDEQKLFAEQLLTIAMKNNSASLEGATALVSLEGIARANMVQAMNGYSQSLGGDSDNGWTPGMKRWTNGIARSKGEPEPFPGFAMGGLVTKTGLALVHEGEKIDTPAQQRGTRGRYAADGNPTVNVYPNNLYVTGNTQAGIAGLAGMFLGNT